MEVSTKPKPHTLFQDLQAQFGLTYLFIAHDLSVVRHISNRVAVMYLGRVVEVAENRALYENPLHPYTRALLSAAPVPDPSAQRRRIVLEGDVPSPANVPSGCPFHPRCPERVAECSRIAPELKDAGGGHSVACILRH